MQPAARSVTMDTFCASASGCSRCIVRRATSATSTSPRRVCVAPASSFVRHMSFSVVLCSRSASEPMSEANSRMVAGSISPDCVMESDSSRMAASGVRSSWLASETKRRRASSVASSRPVSTLNSSDSSVTSSEPCTLIR